MTDEYVKLIANTLKASGILNSLVFRIGREGEREYVAPDGSTFRWYVEPAQFTFPETVAMGTVTLPSLVVVIDDGEDALAFRLPYEFAITFAKDAFDSLDEAFRSSIEEISIDYRNAKHIMESKAKMVTRKTQAQEEHDRGYM